mgnify:CR=1 FL=1
MAYKNNTTRTVIETTPKDSDPDIDCVILQPATNNN